MRNVVVSITGGLGNQLFQFAAAQSLCLSKKGNLVFEISHFENQNSNESFRNFALDSFQIEYTYVSDKNLSKKYLKFNGIKKYFYKLPFIKKYFSENQNKFNSDFKKLETPVFLRGHFHSIKYFENFKNEIRSILSVKQIHKSQKVKEYEELIMSLPDSVSIHFRRTDYVKNKFGEIAGGELPLNYYYQSLKLISDHLQNASLIIFSDDIEWVKANFYYDLPIYFIENASGGLNDNGIADLYLMSKCKNHIIANSTFSWWGAFLNKNLNKIVISPKWWTLEDYWTPNFEPVILKNI